MKRLGSNRNLGRKKYSRHQHVEYSGIGTRQLSDAEIDRLQMHVENIRAAGVPHPIRLKVPA